TLRPRVLRPARWMFRLVDPGDLATTSREATIDQLEPASMVNPVAGFLLPDHIDEALEVFDAAGNPLGQLFHEPISGGVTWEITRDDDGVLGFFVDDDFSHFHVVDKVVRDSAADAGRGRGQLGILGSNPPALAVRAITHPYIVAEDEILVRPGQTVRLTILMHPGGKCHLTSGILPRKSLQLSRDWIHDGLATIAPSARIGPVL